MVRNAIDHLTSREREVLARVGLGMRDKETAADLGIAENTVRSHVRNLLRRLGASNRAHAVAIGGSRRRPNRPQGTTSLSRTDEGREGGRPSLSSRGYGTAWRNTFAAILADEPNCRWCGAPATTVDHIKPLLGGGADSRPNLQSLCRGCHARKTIIDVGRRRAAR